VPRFAFAADIEVLCLNCPAYGPGSTAVWRLTEQLPLLELLDHLPLLVNDELR
jgi:hypothetical protein